jgi:hypothetical protein
MSPFLQGLLALTLAGAPAMLRADAPTPVVPEVPDATITLTGGVIGLGIGYEWAHGTLSYQGRTFPFRVHGLSVMDIGAARITGTGEVFNLKTLAQFEGDYAGSTFGSAVSRGSSLALIKNESGVIIKARSSISGVRFNFSGNGIRIQFTLPPKAHGADASVRTGGTRSLPALGISL